MHRLGPFDIIEPIGEGGMGTVWRAVHRTQKVPAAVKFVLQETGTTDKLLERFADEVRAVAGLDHPGIVSVFDYGTVLQECEESTDGLVKADTPWLAMELITGGTIKAHPPKNWHELHDHLTAMLSALASAHARGILHRDLKPDNVLLSAPGDLRQGLRLVDFGLAFLDGADHSGEQRAAGTPRYMAPEQLLSNWRDYGPWTDLYALGCLAWQMATGATPFHGMKQFRQLVRAHLHLAPPPFRPLFRVPDDFEAWLRTLLAKRRTDRFRFAADALATLPEREPADVLDHSIEITALNEPASELDATIPDMNSLGTIPLGTEPSLVDDKTPVSVDLAAAKQEAGDRSLPAAGTSLDETIPDMPDDWLRSDEGQQRLQLLGVGLGLFGLRHTSLVGRKDERSVLWQSLRAVRESGRPELIMLEGGPGSGKSRLADWLLHRAHELGAGVTLRCFHDPQSSAGSGLPGMIAQHLHTTGLGREDLEDRVAKLLDRQGVADAYEVRALCDFLDVDSDNSISEFSVSVQFQSPAERMALVVRFLRRAAARRPVVLWVDDIQWGDEAIMLMRALQQLAPEQHCPVLVIMTLRDDLLADRPLERVLLSELDQEGITRLAINQLPSEDQIALVEDMLGLEPNLAKRVVARSQGNPLFAVQLVGDWVQRHVLEVGKQGFRLRRGTSAAIPSSIQEVWNERIDALLTGLPQGSEIVLELAATLGMDVSREEWEQACATQNVTVSAELLEGLLRRRLAIAIQDQTKFRHAHGMLRECLITRAREGKRLAQHHLSCASVLVKKSGQHGIAERRARHLIAAQAHEEALAPLLQAATERNASSDFRQAYALLDVYQKAAGRAGLPTDDERTLQAQILRSQIENMRGKSHESKALAGNALNHARRLDSPLLIGASLRVLGSATRSAGHTHDALELFEEALEQLEKVGATDLICRVNLHLTEILGSVGSWEKGEGHIQRALKEATKLQSAYLIGQTHFYAALLSWRKGNGDAASHHYGLAARSFEEAGNRHGLADCTLATGQLARADGRYAEAEKGFHEAIEIYRSIGSGNDIGSMMELGLVHLDTGNYGAAQAILETGCRRCRQAEKNHMLGCALACLLPCYASAQDWQTWDDALNESRTLLEETGVLSADVARPLQTAAQLAIEADQPERAKQAYEMALRQWMGLGRDEQVGEVMQAMDSLHPN